MTRLGTAVVGLCLCGCSSGPEPAPKKRVAARPEPPRILQFYASPVAIVRGEAATMCYSVENARTVRIDPPVEALSPSPIRCFPVSPERSTRYTLYVEGEGGAPASQSLLVQVRPRPAPVKAVPPEERLITLFAAASSEIAAGQAVTLCYGVQNAASVKLEPGARALEPVPRRCFNVQPAGTTTYTLVVSGEGGRTDREQLIIRVK